MFGHGLAELAEQGVPLMQELGVAEVAVGREETEITQIAQDVLAAVVTEMVVQQ
jgi:hypothetical protein